MLLGIFNKQIKLSKTEVANCLDFKNKAEHKFESVEYFVDRFPTLKNYSKR